MYLEHFQLTELPFRLSPDPAFLYLSKHHARAKAYMESTIWFTDGFVRRRLPGAGARHRPGALDRHADRPDIAWASGAAGEVGQAGESSQALAGHAQAQSRMKRGLKWGLPLLAVVVLGAAVGSVLIKRKASAPAVAIVKAPAALELAASDVLTLRVEDLSRTLDISGSLFAVNSAFVKARVAAEVKSLSVREGDTVRAGQVLGQLDTAEFGLRLRQAEQQAEAARAQLDIAQRTLTNNKALMAQGFISATGLEQAVSTQAGAQANLQAALAGVELARKSRGDATISAPIAGQISQRLVQPGERVPVDARLLEIVDLSRIEMQAAVAPEDAGKLRVGATALLKIDGIDAAVPARVARINPSAQAGSRSVLAYLELSPNPALRQGLFARGTIELERRSTLALPLSALRTDQAKPYVLRIEGSQVKPRVLELGVRGLVGATEVVEVRQGLAAGDRLLAGSVGAVPDGTAVRMGTAAGAAMAEAAAASAASAAAPARAASAAP